MFGSGCPFMPHTISGVRIHRLLDAHAARDGSACWRRPRDAGRPHNARCIWRSASGPAVFSTSASAYAGPFGAARAAIGPLVAARRRREAGAAVAAAFQHHAPRHRLVFRFQLAERHLELVVHLAVDGDLPLCPGPSPPRESGRCCGCRISRSAWCRRRAGFPASRRPADGRRARPALRSCRGISDIAGPWRRWGPARPLARRPRK